MSCLFLTVQLEQHSDEHPRDREQQLNLELREVPHYHLCCSRFLLHPNNCLSIRVASKRSALKQTLVKKMSFFVFRHDTSFWHGPLIHPSAPGRTFSRRSSFSDVEMAARLFLQGRRSVEQEELFGDCFVDTGLYVLEVTFRSYV
jgi:hypothetical protein